MSKRRLVARSYRRVGSVAFLQVALVLCTGCAGYGENPVGAHLSLLNAELSGPEDDAVVQLVSMHESGPHRCTGTLVAPNLVLTARHCVANHVLGDFDCDPNGDLVSRTGGMMGAVVAPELITVRLGTEPANDAKDALGAQVFSLETTTMCRNDIALVLLDRQLSNEPRKPIRIDRSAFPGERVSAIGYGVYVWDTGFGVRHRKSDLPITKVGASQFVEHPDSIPPRSFQIDGGDHCIGDSGGPAISDAGAVIGVYSKSNGVCTATTTVNWYTETAPFFEELIRPAFRAAGVEPIVEAAAGTGNRTTSAGGTAQTERAGAGGTGGQSVVDIDSRPIGVGGGSPDGMVYDGSPPSGGTCHCRAQLHSRTGWITILGLLWLARGRRSRPRTQEHRQFPHWL